MTFSQPLRYSRGFLGLPLCASFGCSSWVHLLTTSLHEEKSESAMRMRISRSRRRARPSRRLASKRRNPAPLELHYFPVTLFTHQNAAHGIVAVLARVNTPIQVGAAETSTVYRGDQEPGTPIQNCCDTYDDDTIVVSIRAHQYKLPLGRQVLRIGGTKNRAQQYKLALRQREVKFNTCYSNANEPSQDALRHI